LGGWPAGWLAGLADREHAPPSLHPAPPTRKLPLHAAGARRWSPLAKWRLRWAGLWLTLRSLWPQAECQAVPCKSGRPAAHSFSITLPNWRPCMLIPCREFNELPHFISHRQAAQQLRQGRGALTSHSRDHSDARPWLPGACYNVHMLHCVFALLQAECQPQGSRGVHPAVSQPSAQVGWGRWWRQAPGRRPTYDAVETRICRT
jgi:hypothetical protein